MLTQIYTHEATGPNDSIYRRGTAAIRRRVSMVVLVALAASLFLVTPATAHTRIPAGGGISPAGNVSSDSTQSGRLPSQPITKGWTWHTETVPPIEVPGPLPYPTGMFRAFVDYCTGHDCRKAAKEIMNALAIVGGNQAELYITLVATPCVKKKVKKKNVIVCPTENMVENGLKYTLPMLMPKFPGVRYWAVENEPDLNLNNHYSAQFAARLWVDAQLIAARSGRTIVPGEFTMEIPGKYPATITPSTEFPANYYPRQYLEALNSAIGKSPDVPAPSIWSIHPYYDIACDGTGLTQLFLKTLSQMSHLANAVRHIWLSEAGVALTLGQYNMCPNARAMVEMSNPKVAAQAQANAAWRFLTLPDLDRRIDHEFYYGPQPADLQCSSGRFWDTGLWNSVASALRPAYYVLATNSRVLPKSYLATVDASTLEPPEFASPKCLTLLTGDPRGATAAYAASTLVLSAAGGARPGGQGLGVAPVTSPSITTLSNGGREFAFQAYGTGHLWVTGDAGTVDTDLGMAPGTSPSIAALANGGFEAAFEAYGSDELWVYGTAGIGPTGLGMAPGTSPSIAGLAGGGFEVALHAYGTGRLWVYGTAGTVATNLGLADGTSPSITGLLGGGFEAAFQAFGTRDLWFYGSAGTSDTGRQMAPGTSPSITGLREGGFVAAFHDSQTEVAWVSGPYGSWPVGRGFGMQPGTSPSIAATTGTTTGGYEITFCGFGDAVLWFLGSAGVRKSGEIMAAGTSPSITGGPSPSITR